MHGQITDAGVAAINAAGGPPILSAAIIGSAYNYIPQPGDTNIHGTVLFNTAPSVPQVENANLVRYSVYLDHNVGNFEFGELALMMGSGTMFGLFASSELINKTNIASGESNSVRIDVYLSMVGSNYTMWADLSQSDSQLRIPSIHSVDQLPPSKNARPNIYVVPGLTSNQSPTIAFTDQQGLWTFDAYSYSTIQSLTVVDADADSIYIAEADFNPDLSPDYLGDIIVEFTTGNLYGICRNVESVTLVNGTYQIRFLTPIAQLPVAGDKFVTFSRTERSVDNLNLPIASKSQLGIMRVGDYLQVINGLVSVDVNGLQQALVVSVNGKSGIVILKAEDIEGISKVGKTGIYSDLDQIPSAFNPYIASNTRLGGVMVKPGSLLQVDASGNLSLAYTPVTSVNGETGDVTINSSIGLVNPTDLNGASLNTITNPGLYFGEWVDGPSNSTSGYLEVIPGANSTLQRATVDTTLWLRVITNNVPGTWFAGQLEGATSTRLGGIRIGSGFTIDANFVLSASIKSVNGQNSGDITITLDSLGGIPKADINVPGGVPSLDEDPGDPYDHPIESDFLYGRIPSHQAALGSLVIVADWDADTNTLVNLVIDNNFYEGRLENDGKIKVWFDGDDETTAETFYMEGAIVLVSTAGSTNIDGYSNWTVGTPVLAVANKWIPQGQSQALDLISSAADNGLSLVNGKLFVKTVVAVSGVGSSYTPPKNQGDRSLAVGSEAEALAGGVAVGDNANADADSTAIGSGAIATDGSIAIGKDSSTSRPNEVSVGNDTLDRFVASVKTPEKDNDAANMGYVKEQTKLSTQPGNRIQRLPDGLAVIDEAPPNLSVQYISTSGNDTNAGTKAAPLKTIKEALKRISEDSGFGRYLIGLKSGQVFELNDHLPTLRNAELVFGTYDDPVFGDYGLISPIGYYPWRDDTFVRATMRFTTFTDPDDTFKYPPVIVAAKGAMYGIKIDLPNTKPDAPSIGSYIVNCAGDWDVGGCDIQYRYSDPIIPSTFGRIAALRIRSTNLNGIDVQSGKLLDVVYGPRISSEVDTGGAIVSYPNMATYTERSVNMRSLLTPDNIQNGGGYDNATKSMFGWSANWDVFS